MELGRNDIVTFLDSNPLNCDIDNLIRVDRATLRTMSQNFSEYNIGDAEIKKSVIALVNNIEAVRKIKQEKEN